jgi:protein-tyrosine-phosphatase
VTQERDTFDIAVLCSGNRFRSPLATALIRRRAPQGVRVASAAAASRASGNVLPEALELGPIYGVNLESHRARPLPPRALASAGLVLGFERLHLGTAIDLGGAPPAASFTLPELVELLEAIPAASIEGLPPGPRARRAVALAHELRTRRDHDHDAVPELSDPLGSSHVVFVELAATIDRLVARMCNRLFGA